LNKLENEIQLLFDYIKIYMSLYLNDDNNDKKNILSLNEMINNILSKYRNQNLIKLKKKLFEDIEILVNDMSSDYKREDENDDDSIIHSTIGGDRSRAMDKLSSKQPSIDFRVQNKKIIISFSNVQNIIINFYTMNTEVLFSFQPFLILDSDNNNNNNNNNNKKSTFSYVTPNYSEIVNFKDNNTNNNEYEYNIPTNLLNQNLFIECISQQLNISKTYYDTSSVVVHLKENYGQLQVLKKNDKNEWIPAKQAYIKVYCKTQNNNNEFYKDGYTDIRGLFDYVSISTDQLERTSKFSILISVDNCCIVKEANVPKR